MNWTERRKRDRRRRLATRFLGVVAGGLSLLFAGGVFLPIEQVRSARAMFARPPEMVWRVLTDLDGMPLWRSDLAAVERLPDLAGRPAWREVSRGGDRVVELSYSEPPHRLVIQGATGGRGGLPVRSFDLVSTPQGTLVTLTDRVEVRNPLRRVLVRLRVPRANLRRLLSDLDQVLNANRRQVAAVQGAMTLP
jgi:uncharacterized protein YndB with AHSA1/START domain